MAQRHIVPIALLALLLGLAGGAPAHFGERTDSLWGFVARSDVVVVGRVVASRRLEERGHTPAPGAVRVRVEEVLRGALPDAEVGILVAGMHQPRYEEGERVLVFARRAGATLRSLQSRSEKIAVGAGADPAVAAARRYATIAELPEVPVRARRLKEVTFELLRSPVPRLHRDAVFDLSRPGLLDPWISAVDVGRLGELAADERAPLVVREGILAKLGVLARAGRADALAPVARLAATAGSAAVRVAALSSLRNAGADEGVEAMIRATADADAWVRLAAVEGLRALRAPRARAALERAAGGDPDPRVRHVARAALAALAGRDAIVRRAENGKDER